MDREAFRTALRHDNLSEVLDRDSRMGVTAKSVVRFFMSVPMSLKDFTAVDTAGRGRNMTVFRAHVFSRRISTYLQAQVVALCVPHDRDVDRKCQEALKRVRDHEHCVSVRADFVEKGRKLLVLKYEHGLTLRKMFDTESYSSNRGFNLLYTLRAADQILGALSFMHENGVAHQGIRAENIIDSNCMCEMDQPLYPDLRIVGFSRASCWSGISRHRFQIEPRATIGDPYASPEHNRRERIDARPVDAYSFGVLFYEMLEGRTPFAGQQRDALLNMKNACPQTYQNTTGKAYGNEIIQISRRLLHPDPSTRLTCPAAHMELKYLINAIQRHNLT